jgi:hypothetical protein
MTLLSQVRDKLHPIKVREEKIFSRNTDLYAVDVTITIKFLLDNLSSQNTVLSNALKYSWIERISSEENTIPTCFFTLIIRKIKLLRTIMAVSARSKNNRNRQSNCRTDSNASRSRCQYETL